MRRRPSRGPHARAGPGRRRPHGRGERDGRRRPGRVDDPGSIGLLDGDAVGSPRDDQRVRRVGVPPRHGQRQPRRDRQEDGGPGGLGERGAARQSLPWTPACFIGAATSGRTNPACPTFSLWPGSRLGAARPPSPPVHRFRAPSTASA